VDKSLRGGLIKQLSLIFVIIFNWNAFAEKATFAAGCFWGVEEFFRKIPGVQETGVGYTGGDFKNPNYSMVSGGKTGHAESVEVIFDSKKVSYEKLLDLFFKMHDPTTLNQQGNDIGPEYRSVIFYHSEEQKKSAEKFKSKVEKSKAWKKPIVTAIEAAKIFYEAEEEHQKYLLRNPKGYDNHYLRKISFDEKVKRK
jgi:methionine-S-sulfoxide reductase